MEVVFIALHTEMQERFRQHATAKLARIEKLASKTIRVEVHLSEERNPRQSGTRERVEITVISRGPAIRAEAAAEDRIAALDLAFGKLEARLRRACDRRKSRNGAHASIRLGELPEADLASDAELPAIRLTAGGGLLAGQNAARATARMAAAADAADALDAASAADEAEDDRDPALVEIDMEGDGPVVVREKFHAARPMGLDQALFEMELVGHDFFLFTDAASGLPSVVYRRRGYHYGVIRLVSSHAADEPEAAVRARAKSNGHAAGRIPAPAQVGNG